MKLNKKQHENKTGIYCIRNITTQKIYVGKAKCIYRRIKDHITRLNKKSKNENPYLINSWNKYGKNDFEYFVLEYCLLEDLSDREIYWMKKLEALNPKKGYNLREDSSTGMVVKQETRIKMRDAQLKRFENENERKKCSHNYWKTHPEELKLMSRKVSKLNIKYSIEQYDKVTKRLVKKWKDIHEVMEAHPEYKKHNIYAVCSGKKPSIYGYIWKKIKL